MCGVDPRDQGPSSSARGLLEDGAAVAVPLVVMLPAVTAFVVGTAGAEALAVVVAVVVPFALGLLGPALLDANPLRSADPVLVAAAPVLADALLAGALPSLHASRHTPTAQAATTMGAAAKTQRRDGLLAGRSIRRVTASLDTGMVVVAPAPAAAT